MSGWIAFWKAVSVLGLASYALLAVAMIPMGLRDLRAMLRDLAATDGDEGTP